LVEILLIPITTIPHYFSQYIPIPYYSFEIYSDLRRFTPKKWNFSLIYSNKEKTTMRQMTLLKALVDEWEKNKVNSTAAMTAVSMIINPNKISEESIKWARRIFISMKPI